MRDLPLPHGVRSRALLYGVLLALVVGLAVVVAAHRPTAGDTADRPRPEAGSPEIPSAPVNVPIAVGGAPTVETPRLDGEAAAAAAPLRIQVPRLKVDSAVLPISGESGVLEPPGDPRELGWWREGAVPGAELGSSVLTGHTVHTGGGALDHLARLRNGDRIVVLTERGRVRYEVRATWVLSKPELAERALDLFDQGRPGRLVLVTCSDWTGSEYLSNAVVSAIPVGSRVRG